MRFSIGVGLWLSKIGKENVLGDVLEGSVKLKGRSQLMHMRIKYRFLADLHVTRRA